MLGLRGLQCTIAAASHTGTEIDCTCRRCTYSYAEVSKKNDATDVKMSSTSIQVCSVMR